MSPHARKGVGPIRLRPQGGVGGPLTGTDEKDANTNIEKLIEAAEKIQGASLNPALA